MAKMLGVISLSASVTALARQQQESTVTPVEKVIELISGMNDKLKAEAEAEAKTYGEFSCYCKDTTADKTTSIKDGQNSIDMLSAEIASKTSERESKSTELADAKSKLEELERFLEETNTRCAKEKAEYMAADADLVKAITSLESAKAAMENTKPGAAAAGLLSVKAILKTSPRFEEAMKLMDAGPKWQAFLQTKSAVDPSDPDYKYHSQGIVDLLDKLHAEFTEKKATADTDFSKSSTACDKTKAETSSEIDLTKGTIADTDTAISTLTERLAGAREELVQADNVLKDDKLYITDLTALCETRAKQYDQRSSMRAKESEALTSALDILKGRVAGVEGERALLETAKKAEKPAVSFIQEKSTKAMRVKAHQKLATAQVLDGALQFLQAEGQRLHSNALVSLVARAGADPFAKVKTLIQQLTERLIKEATEEATKKGFCDTELSKAKQDRDFRLAEVHTLSADISALETTHDELDLEIADLTKALKDLALSAEEAKKIREEEKAENSDALADARSGLEATKEALGILKTFYKNAAKALIQTRSKVSPIAADNPGAGYDGNYQGNQAESGGVIGLLEVIVTDFEHTVETVSSNEKQQASDYVEFDRVTKGDISAKTTKKELDEQDLETTKTTHEAKTKEMKTNQDLVDSALKELQELTPVCVDNVQSYEDRVAKREEEIAALKKALCQLDADGVEEMCQE